MVKVMKRDGFMVSNMPMSRAICRFTLSSCYLLCQ